MTIIPPEKLSWKFTIPCVLISIGIIPLYWLRPPSWGSAQLESYDIAFLYSITKWFFTIAISIAILGILACIIWGGDKDIGRE